MTTLHEHVARVTDAIEAELTRLGRWSATRPADEKFVDMGAFGMKTLTAEQWIQFVLLPRAREVIAQKGEFPGSSNVAAWAMRNFDGDDEADRLLRLLSQFDSLFDDGPPDSAEPAPAPADPKLTRLTARLAQELARHPGVKSAYLAQLYFPGTEQLTTPVLALELDGPLAVDALAHLPPDDPFIAMALAEDAISRLLRQGTPFYARAT